MPRRATHASPALPALGRGRDLVPLLLVLAAVALAFSPVLRAGYFWDDTFYVLRNAALRSDGGVPLSALFTTPILGHIHPVTIASLALDHALWELDPFGYHLSNLLLHLANVALVHALVRQWSGKGGAAWVAALVFGIHPLRVEPVAWVSSRKDLLATAFMLIAILFYERWAERAERRAYAASLGTFVLAVLSKGSSVALALLLPLLDYRAGRSLRDRRRVLDKLPFLAIAAAGGALALWAALGTGVVASDRGHGIVAKALYTLLAVVTYLGKSLWPADLSAFYPYPAAGTPPSAVAWAAPFVLLTLAGAVVATLRRTRTVAFGFLFFLASIVLMLRPVGGAWLADRYTYLAGAGLAYLAGAGYAALAGSASPRAARAVPFARAAVLLAAVALGAATWARAHVWRDAPTLWNDVLAKHPDAWVAWHARATLKVEAGDTSGAVRDLDEAVRVLPSAARSFALRANLKADLGDAAGARADYVASLRLDGGSAETHYNLGYLELEQNRLPQAIASLTRAVELDPGFVQAWFHRAEARARSGDLAGAATDFGAALARDPSYAPALYGRAKARFLLGDAPAAAADLAGAARLGFPIDDGFARAVAEKSRR